MSIWHQLRTLLGIRQPLPAAYRQMPLAQVKWLALDLELTGLDVKTAEITSIGWVIGGQGDIQLADSFYQIVKTDGNLAQSPVIHGLTHEQLALGKPLETALEALAPLANIHVWVLHNASLDLGVLDRVLRIKGEGWPPLVALDTLKLAVYQLRKQHEVLPPNSATLAVCRQRLGLPYAPAHNALDDALATLQLWYAQQRQLGIKPQQMLSELLHTGALSVIQLGIDKQIKSA